MASLAGFDADQVNDQPVHLPVPPGKYVAIITDSEMKATKDGQGQYLQLVHEIIDDSQGKGKKLWARLNLVNNNQTARDIANRELARICKAVGVPRPQDSAQLHNIPMLVTVDIERDNKGEKNILKDWEPVNAVGGAPAPQQQQAPAQQQPAPQYQAPAQQQPQYQQAAPQQQQNAPAAGGSAPPWGRK